jgi:hypothetical protein
MTSSKIKTTAMAGAALLLVAAITSMVILRPAKPKYSPPQQLGQGAVDRSTPRGALLVMVNAMWNGDAQKYVESFEFTSNEELKLKATLERVVAANARFKRAVSDKFGAAAADAIVSSLPLMASPELIDSAAEKLEGDSATLALGNGPPVQLSKVDGEWMATVEGVFHMKLSVMDQILSQAIGALDETSAGIRRNKYQTTTEAVNAMIRKAR